MLECTIEEVSVPTKKKVCLNLNGEVHEPAISVRGEMIPVSVLDEHRKCLTYSSICLFSRSQSDTLELLQR